MADVTAREQIKILAMAVLELAHKAAPTYGYGAGNHPIKHIALDEEDALRALADVGHETKD